jgi:hypothetical protein
MASKLKRYFFPVFKRWHLTGLYAFILSHFLKINHLARHVLAAGALGADVCMYLIIYANTIHLLAKVLTDCRKNSFLHWLDYGPGDNILGLLAGLQIITIL